MKSDEVEIDTTADRKRLLVQLRRPVNVIIWDNIVVEFWNERNAK